MTAERIDWVGLVVESVQNPPSAAERIKSWHLPRGVLYQALLVTIALNTLMYGIAHYVTPTERGILMGLNNPIFSLLMGFGGVIILIHLYYWAGRAIGGTGTMGEFLSLFIWFQVISLIGLVLTVVAFFIFPVLGLMVNLSVLIFSIWLIVHFFKSGLGLSSLWHAAGLLVGVPVGVVVGLSVLIVLIGAADLGIPSNV